MKQVVKRILQRLGLYERLRWTAPFRALQALRRPDLRAAAAHERSFYQSFLQPGALIFDIGANDGHKTEAFLTLAQTVVACEPDATNFNILQRRFAGRKKRVHLLQKALGAAPGNTEMQVHHPGSAFNTLNPKFRDLTQADNVERWNEKIAFTATTTVEVTTLDALMTRYGRPHFIKVDVEGYELEVVRGLSQAVPCLSLECLYPEFMAELAQSRTLLRQLDPDLRYNISMNERLLYDHWLDDAALDRILEFWREPHFELIVRMPSANA